MGASELEVRALLGGVRGAGGEGPVELPNQALERSRPKLSDVYCEPWSEW